MAPPFAIADLNGGEGAYVHDLAFGKGPQQNLGSVSGTVTFDPTAALGGAAKGVGTILFSPSGNLTGAIIVAGIRERQTLRLVNEHATNSVTFAAVGTSHVLGGANVSVPAASAMDFVWDTNISRWVAGAQAAITVGGVTATSGQLNTLTRVGSVAAETYSASVSLDVTVLNHRIAAANGTAAASTFTPSAAGSDGDILEVEVVSDAGGTCTITFGSGFKPSATLAVTASHFGSVRFRSDGTNWKEMSRSAIIAS